MLIESLSISEIHLRYTSTEKHRINLLVNDSKYIQMAPYEVENKKTVLENE